MRNFISDDENITLVAPTGGVVGGELYVINSMAGVVHESAPAGSRFVLELEGIYTLPKNSADVFAVGTKVYYDPETFALTTAATHGTTPAVANVYVGMAVAAAGAGTTEGAVRLYC